MQESGREIGLTGPGTADSQPRPPGLAACAAGLVALAAVLGVGGHFLGPEAWARGGWLLKASAVVVAALVGTAVWAGRKPLQRTLTSLPFAAALLALILAATAVGTFVLQGAEPAEYGKKYGAALGTLLLKLGLDDLFHSSWFAGWLVLLAHSLVLVAVRKQAWRPMQWGHGLAHVGIVVILAGGFLGNRFGMKGHLDLQEGMSADSVIPEARAGATARPHPRPFGFTVRLEDFDIERRPPEHRLYVYEREGESYRTLRSFGLKEAASWRPAGSSGSEFRVVREYPDFRLRAELEEVPPGQGVPALRVEIQKANHSSGVNLFAGAGGRDSADLAAWGAPLLRFAWDPPSDAEVSRWSEPRPERHVVAVKPQGGGAGEEAEIRVGGEVTMSGGAWRVRALAFYADFVFDSESRQATSRSNRPDNPALQVEVSSASGGPAEKRWLFAKMPDFGHAGDSKKAGPGLVYRHERGYAPAAREVFVVGKTGEAWELEGGRVQRKSLLGAGGGTLPGAPGTRVTPLASARERRVPESRSSEWRNPAVEIERRGGGETHSHLLKAAHGEPLELPDGRTILAFEPKPEDVKAYRSRLAVLEGGRKVVEKTVEVNDPLSYGGFAFYQSSYRKEDPTYSGILVVRDPGLPLVWTGLIMICLGMIYVYYVRPRLLKGRAA